MSIRLLAGAALLVVAAIINPYYLEGYVILDGYIARKMPIVAVEVILVIAAICLIVRARGRPPAPVSRRKRLLAASVLGFALLFSCIVCEVALRLFVSPTLILEGEAYFEYSWRARQTVADQEPVDWRYDYDRFDTQYGWLPKVNYHSSAVQTNSLGIRATREYSFERTEGIRRIVLVGDSFTWGEKTWANDITNSETFASLLEQRLVDTESINLGVHAWGTDQQLIYLRELGLRFQPDLVILGFFEPDIMRNTLGFFAYSKPRFDIDSGALVLVNSPVLESDAMLASPFELPSCYLFALAQKGLNNVLDRTRLRPIEGREEWQVTRAIFDAAKREAESAGAKFLLVDIPPGVQRRPTPVELAVAKWAEESGAHFLSLREHFTRFPQERWGNMYNGHFTAFGHDATANAIIEAIENASLLPRLPSPK